MPFALKLEMADVGGSLSVSETEFEAVSSTASPFERAFIRD